MSDKELTDIEDAIKDIQQGIEKDENEIKDSDCAVSSCPICRHPAREILTEVYYENGRDIGVARQFFINKFSKSFSESTWEKHFRDHVDPFIKSHEIVKRKKLDDLMERTAESKKEGKVSPVSMIKQMLFDFMLDSYVYKPAELRTKQERVDFTMMAKNLSTLAKTYKEYQQMEMDILAYGKTEDEQKNIMKNYMTNMIGDILKMFEDDPDAQEKISSAFGITGVEGGKSEIVDFEIE